MTLSLTIAFSVNCFVKFPLLIIGLRPVLEIDNFIEHQSEKTLLRVYTLALNSMLSWIDNPTMFPYSCCTMCLLPQLCGPSSCDI